MKLTIFYSNGKQYTLKGSEIEVSDLGYMVAVSVVNKPERISNVVTKYTHDVIEIKKSDLLGMSKVVDNVTVSYAFSKNFGTVNFFTEM